VISSIKLFLEFISALKYIKLLIDAVNTFIKSRQHGKAVKELEKKAKALDRISDIVEQEKQRPVSEQNNDNLRNALREIKK